MVLFARPSHGIIELAAVTETRYCPLGTDDPYLADRINTLIQLA